jgi:hypothetical protein
MNLCFRGMIVMANLLYSMCHSLDGKLFHIFYSARTAAVLEVHGKNGSLICEIYSDIVNCL